jgi:hypothetical protein
MLRILSLSALSLSILTVPLSAYQLASPLLDHLNMITEKSQIYKLSIINNEEEDIEAEINFGEIIQQKDGLTTLSDNLPEGVIVENLNKNFLILKGEKKEFSYRIDTNKVKKESPFLGLGFLVAKKAEENKTLGPKNTDQVQAGFIIRQKFLVQIMAKLQKTGIGKADIDEIQLKDEKLIFTVKNNSNHLLEGDVVLFPKTTSNKTEEPISQYVRVLPQHERIYKVDLKSTSIKNIQMFFDNPYFDLIEKEIEK